ncbi:MAG: 3D-(3,5/4)-trihydroxycyclohexane-1,2-dione acylhydrolase (decyclizing) [Chloroflexota bacterium]
MPLHNQSTIRLTMGQAIVKYLANQYSERDGIEQRFIPAMFGIFGHGNVAGLGQALQEDAGETLTFMQPHNEQSMVHTASGFAKANRRLRALACTSSVGPGATNMLTGAGTATINRLPVLLFPADYYTTRHQGPVLQQLQHPVSMDVSVNDAFRPLSRFFDRITRPEHLLTALPEAMRVMTNPADTGACTIAIPQDLQAHAYDYPAHFFKKMVWRIERRLPDPRRIAEVVELLKSAQRPFIMVGGGVIYSEAEAQLLQFAENFGIPVGETMAGKGAMDYNSAMAVGGAGVTGTASAGHLMTNADLVICIGTRLTDFSTGSHSAFQNPDVKFVGVNVGGFDAHRLGATPLLADARLALEALNEAATEAGITPNADYVADIAKEKAAWEETCATEAFVQHDGEIMNQIQVLHAINEQSQAGDTILTAAGGPPGDLHQLWNTANGSKVHLEFGNSCMGYEIPASLGARMAQGPEGEIYCYIGDGTYLMQPTEIVTALQEGLKVTVIVINNHGFQIIRRLQMARVGVSFGNEFRDRDEDANRLEGEYLPIDFVKNAESMGARGWRVTNLEELGQALTEARAVRDQVCVIECEVEKHRYGLPSDVWWDVAPAEVTDTPETQAAREEFETDRFNLQKFYY